MDVLEKDMRIIARFEKNDSVRFVSHLDVQRLFHRAMRRAGLPIAYSNGLTLIPLCRLRQPSPWVLPAKRSGLI